MPLLTCKTIDEICMKPSGENSKVCGVFDLRVITDIIEPYPRTKDEINL